MLRRLFSCLEFAAEPYMVLTGLREDSLSWRHVLFNYSGMLFPMSKDNGNEYILSVVMPCLNEERTLGPCIEKALKSITEMGIAGEVVVADNGSTDGSRKIAEALGARVVSVTEKGYGAALRGGIDAAWGKYVIMGDADESYDFSAIAPFVEKLEQGFDLVMGNRFKGGIAPGAMPPLHRYLGNPVLSFVGRLFFRSDIGDFHCGLRGFSKEAYVKWNLKTTGMEFASEMVVKATLLKMKVCEVPTTLSPDGRDRPPHLRSWRDGWRHLRFLLIFSPRWLFIYPGAALAVIGLFAATLFAAHGRINSMLLGLAIVMIGMQAFFLGVMVRYFAWHEGLMPASERLKMSLKSFTLERGLLSGTVPLLLGFGGFAYSGYVWAKSGFAGFPADLTNWVIVPSTFLIMLGGQLICNSFVLSILLLDHVGGRKTLKGNDEK